MTKILNISSGIKINKDNVESPYTKVKKGSETSTSVTFTLLNASVSKDGMGIVLIDNATIPELALVTIHNGKIKCKMLTGDSTISVSNNSLTVNTSYWSVVSLIDFEGNIWS